MNHKSAQELLHDYIDGILSEPQKIDIELHIQECEICRSDADQIRDLIKQAAALPKSIEPKRDLWPGIAARTQVASEARVTTGPLQRFILMARSWRGFWTPVIATAAAAVLLIIALEMRDSGSIDSSANPSTTGEASRASVSDPASIAVIEALEAECRLSDREIAHFMPDGSAEADGEASSVFRVIADNLHAINQAVAEAKDAWLSDPESPHLARLLAAAYRAKVALQDRAMRVAAQT
ncbi:MAG: zf-HC2 domain-containing protein [Candidatus Eisenbacteria bacterium]|uniref:Zf-HC2 domain-containing protein n=1 Tax=Eiseniibacteriota bacterium TaxID=2212470 RepID=A0A948S0F8_UNCEI|nr:zf-HC2 domain-containing protein [Candidatus Eisenbacteria bacterium]MBU1948886.1 zf-HC2 domain-containing protein [Candidatus Eisenbacteria bacterium]MBU2691549.1 zf-HC2 domain-containing protein [Candidatus Eisenbacteria bacterium]